MSISVCIITESDLADFGDSRIDVAVAADVLQAVVSDAEVRDCVIVAPSARRELNKLLAH